MVLIALCLMLGVAIALDPTALRQSYNPYALYNFMEADGGGNPGVAADLSNQTIKFGNLTVGSERAGSRADRVSVWLVRLGPLPVQH